MPPMTVYPASRSIGAVPSEQFHRSSSIGAVPSAGITLHHLRSSSIMNPPRGGPVGGPRCHIFADPAVSIMKLRCGDDGGYRMAQPFASTIMQKTISAEIIINAPKERVWEILTSFSDYSAW